MVYLNNCSRDLGVFSNSVRQLLQNAGRKVSENSCMVWRGQCSISEDSSDGLFYYTSLPVSDYAD